MCYTWVWAMPVSHVACHSVPLCLPSLCSGRVPCVFISGSCQHVDMLVKPWTLKRYSESLASVWNVTLVMYQFMRFVDVTLLGKCFQLNLNQSNQIDLWMQLSVYVVVAILAKDVWKISCCFRRPRMVARFRGSGAQNEGQEALTIPSQPCVCSVFFHLDFCTGILVFLIWLEVTFHVWLTSWTCPQTPLIHIQGLHNTLHVLGRHQQLFYKLLVFLFGPHFMQLIQLFFIIDIVLHLRSHDI